MPIETITKEVKQCTCYRCGHIWIPREEPDGGQRIPLCCARCKSPYWDTPRQSAPGTVQHLNDVVADASQKMAHDLAAWRAQRKPLPKPRPRRSK